MKSVRDLGALISCKTDFKYHYVNIYRKAHARSRSVLKCFSSRDATILSKAFITYVGPLLDSNIEDQFEIRFTHMI